jgi:hypothetical protein
MNDVGLRKEEVEALFRLAEEDTDADKRAPSEESLEPNEATPDRETA